MSAFPLDKQLIKHHTEKANDKHWLFFLFLQGSVTINEDARIIGEYSRDGSGSLKYSWLSLSIKQSNGNFKQVRKTSF